MVLFFYLLLPLYEAFGEHSTSLFFGALLLGLRSALGIAAMAAWLGGRGVSVPSSRPVKPIGRAC